MKLTIVHNGLTYFEKTAENLLLDGIPQEVIDAEILKVKTAPISGECRRRIYAVASAETQMNMASASAIISSKTSSSRTDQEKAVLAGLEAAIGWVGAMRGAAAMLAADPAKDFTLDEHWPDVPAAAAAIVDHF